MAGDSFIIVDLEATCWEKGTSPLRMETIEIGAVRVGGTDLRPRAEFDRFVRPVSEPILSNFCTQLTGISQDDVNGAEPFPVVFGEFLDWARTEPFMWCSWGAYDLRQLRTDCARHDLQWPLVLERHMNLKAAFAQQMGCRPLGMKEALRKLGIPLAGKHHRAIDDARNIARIGAFLLPSLHPPPAD